MRATRQDLTKKIVKPNFQRSRRIKSMLDW